MRNRDKVLDDLRNSQVRDCTPLQRAHVASHRMIQRALSGIASRELPYGAKISVKIDIPQFPKRRVLPKISAEPTTPDHRIYRRTRGISFRTDITRGATDTGTTGDLVFVMHDAVCGATYARRT